MDKGTYNGRRVNFGRYAASCFNPYLFCGPGSALRGCGACALALLTGVEPETISEKNGGTHYSDAFMTKFLRGHGFRVLPLTQCNLSAAKDYVGTDHVVLLSQLFRRNEATWGVVFRGIYFHNFSVYFLDSLSLLNKPVLSAYVLVDTRWQSQPGEKRATNSSNRPLNLKSLSRISSSGSLMSRSLVKE